MKLKIESAGRKDLVVQFECTCPSELWKGSKIEHLMKTTVRLRGYNDQNFFDNVNKEPRPYTCNCGKGYTQQWFKDGYVEVKEVTE